MSGLHAGGLCHLGRNGDAAGFGRGCSFTPTNTTHPAHLHLDSRRGARPGQCGCFIAQRRSRRCRTGPFGPETVDPYHDKVVRAGMGAHFRLPLRTCPDWAAVQQWLAPTQQIYVAEGRASLAYDQVDWRPPVALVVGGEAEGAGAAARAVATAIRIPMQGQVESLNAAVAGAIILFEVARQRRQASSQSTL